MVKEYRQEYWTESHILNGIGAEFFFAPPVIFRLAGCFIDHRDQWVKLNSRFKLYCVHTHHVNFSSVITPFYPSPMLSSNLVLFPILLHLLFPFHSKAILT